MAHLRRGQWTVEEDCTLINFITLFGEGRWNFLARCAVSPFAEMDHVKGSGSHRVCNQLQSSEEDLADLRRGTWTVEEDFTLINYIACHGEGRWDSLARCAGSGGNEVCNQLQSTEEDKADLRRGPWTVDEDASLVNYIACHGEGRWDSLARCAGLKRTGKSCRLRWLNYLRPDFRRANIILEEELLILELHSRWGNRWSKIARFLPGRTDMEVKNYWRTRVQKHAKQLNCDVDSMQFKDFMRYLWMPKLVERIQAAAAPQNEMHLEVGTRSGKPETSAGNISVVESNFLFPDTEMNSGLEFVGGLRFGVGYIEHKNERASSFSVGNCSVIKGKSPIQVSQRMAAAIVTPKAAIVTPT